MKIKVLILILFVFIPGIVQADFNVEFENDPVFEEAGIMPGDKFERYINVHNSDVGERKVYMKAINYSGSDELSDKINLAIETNGFSVLDGKFSDLIGSNWTELPSLEHNDEYRIDLLASFPKNSQNELQNKSFKFDLVLKSEINGETCQCQFNCGQNWRFRHWYAWNNYFLHWFRGLRFW